MPNKQWHHLPPAYPFSLVMFSVIAQQLVCDVQLSLITAGWPEVIYSKELPDLLHERVAKIPDSLNDCVFVILSRVG